MKYITNLFGVGCVALLAMLFTASGAFAQITYTYVDLDNGSGTTCSSAEPCLLDEGITAASGDTLLVKVRRSGGMVTLVPPTTALAVSVQFGTYARGGGDPVRGTLEFTGDFQIGGGGQFVLHSMATVQFEDVTITDAAGTVSVSSADNEKNSAQRLSITGTLTVPAGTTTVGALVVAEDLMIEGPDAGGATLRVDELMVSNGATLTVGKAGNTVDLRVPLKKSAKDDPRGILTVSGTIDGTGAVWIAHDNTATSTGRGGPGDAGANPPVLADDFFHMSSDYMPDGDNKIDQDDCVRVTGGGEIENEIRAVAAGNICIELGNIGDITVAGSIESPAAGDATTDIIFRNNVEVDGDVVQWNDARVVFEGNATVTGSVILEDGALPTELATFGGARLDAGVATSVRRGVKLASAAEDDAFTCDYISTMDKVRVVDTPVVSLMVDNATIDEGGTATVTATLNKDHPDATAYPITIPVTFGGTATAGTGATDDYTAPDPATITISSGMTGTLAAISPSSTDGAETDAETIIVSLGELPPTVRAGATASVTITINPSTTGNVFVDDGASDMRFFKTQNTATAGPGFYIPGVQFQGVAMIEEDLHVQSSVITNVNSATNRADTRCAPRVIFGASPAGRANSAMMSHIQQDLVIEAQLMEIVDVGGTPTPMPTQRILLDADTGTNVTSAHNLSLDGDVFADGDPIEMESAAVAMDEGMCVNTLSLNAGTRLVLSDDDGHVIVGALTLDALVTQEDLKVDGSLTVSTLHVADGAELESDPDGLVTVSAGLILEGELDGALDTASGLTKLVYGTRRTDLVNVSNLTSLSVYIDDGEFRLDQMTTVENFGLCKGNVVLFEAGGADDHTLTVTEFLTAKDGTLSLDTNDPGSIGSDVSKEAAATDGYILKYVTEGERTASTEWSSHTRKVAVDHKDAVIIVNEAKSLVEGVHLFNGHLHLKGDGSHLTVGMPSVSGVSPLIMVDNAELHANGNNVMVHGAVRVAMGDNEAGKIVTGGGELQVLGTASSMDLNNATAVITVGKAGNNGSSGTIDVGAGALQLGPEATNPKDGLHGDWQYPIAADARPHVKLEVVKGSVMGTVRVPKGSKQTEVIGASFGTIVFDGAATPNKGTVDAGNAPNWNGTLYVVGTGGAGKESVTVDSLNASNGAVEFRGTSATVNKDVAVSSSAIYQELKTLAFKGDLAISGDGGFSSRGGDAANRNSVSIGGDYSQVTTQTGNISEHDPKGGAHLSAHTDKTVTGAFMTSGIGHATRYSTRSGTKLTLKGDFNFGLSAENYMLNADLEFSGKESQTVSAEVDLGSVEVNNSNGIVLADSVMQGSESTLTLTRGVISTMSESTWLVKNAGIEEDVRGRNNAVMTCESGESCESVIKGGSRRAHASAAVSRHVMHGNSGGGELSGGYLFPVGGMSGDR
ncbi:MAG: hypothetical protein F4100_02555, partial [Rhodothermaceae bacterium]|nr:hypothetical protein [Rhodothermaceae bacterium]MYJ19616.1 hypothetical protein [Rhodothermaceae bacterium]